MNEAPPIPAQRGRPADLVRLLADQGAWGITAVAVIALAACAAIRAASHRKPIDHTNVNDEWEGSVTAGLDSSDQQPPDDQDPRLSDGQIPARNVT